MRDWLPPQFYVLRRMEELLSRVAESFGYRRVETPVVEHFEVLARRAGREIVGEIYYFKDRAGRELGLRFDMTVPIARVISYNLVIPRPVRWYYFSRVYRYDEPQHGRYREFHQFGVELVGSSSPRADAEVLGVLAESLRAVGVPDFVVRINDRKMVDKMLESMGVREYRDAIYRALDKKHKLPREAVVKIMTSSGVEPSKAEAIYDAAVEMPLQEAVESTIKRAGAELYNFYCKLLEYLDSASDLDKFVFDMSIVRGLDYYTGMVFEVFAGNYKLAIGGGGRYDSLLELYGGISMPALGFALGVERLMEALGVQGIERPLDYYIYIFDDEAYSLAAAIARRMRASGSDVVIELGDKTLREALEYALRLGARYMVIIGRRELERGVVRVKDLSKREEVERPVTEFLGKEA
jgi:histidyl-tRNA synthetase